jgi:poly-gamma-glutamate synthesis protein (capsule biosynthesis protein)
LFLCGDVMPGRGVDQILAHPGDPRIREPCLSTATAYVELAEQANGPIPRRVLPDYVWGDALPAITAADVDLRIVNLESSVTARGRPVPKGINYRMNPANADALAVARISCCVLANNHVLDWGVEGLLDTLASLAGAGIAVAGAGRDGQAAAAPAVIEAGGRPVRVFGFGLGDSGIPAGWAAGAGRPGIRRLADLSDATVDGIAAAAAAQRRPGDLAVASLHWGGNWGYEVSGAQRRFAHRLIDEAGFDLVHGHSSHHAKAIEIHHGRPILYGCGDFLNDYEGIAGDERYRGDLAVGYVCRLGADGTLESLTLLPFRIRRFRLQHADEAERAWLLATLDRECARFDCRVVADDGGRLRIVAPGGGM